MTSLIEAAIRRRDSLRRLVKLFYEEPEDVSFVRDKLRKLPAPRGSRVPPHAVEDGGSRFEDFEAFTIYAVRAWAALYTPNGGRFDSASEAEEADVGIVVPQAFPEDRVRIYRETIEAYTAARVVANASGGLLLWDGSFRVIVGRHRPGAAEMPLSEAESRAAERLGLRPSDMYYELWRRVNSVVERGLRDPPARSLIEERLGLENLSSDDGVWVSFLEWVEKSMAFRLLLEDSWRRGVTPVFLSKTSRSTSLLGKPLPDVYYLRMAKPVESFLTDYSVLHGIEDIRAFKSKVVRGPFYPRHLGLDEFYRDLLGLAEFYVRLESGGPILKVEVAFNALRYGEDDVADLVEGVVSALSSLPLARGYPYTLLVAHSRARLTRDDMDRVLHALGLGLERSGRHMLEG